MNWLLEPFPHRIGTGFFSEDQYQAMLNNLPSEEEMKPEDPSWNHPDKAVARSACLRTSLREDTKNIFWKEIFAFIKAQYPEEKTNVILLHSLPGFDLWPHTDFDNKKETTVYYLTDKEIPDIGTALFSLKKEFRMPKVDSKAHYNPKYFDLVKTAPFVPNGWMTFQRSDISFHGVLPCPVDRWAIYFTRYL